MYVDKSQQKSLSLSLSLHLEARVPLSSSQVNRMIPIPSSVMAGAAGSQAQAPDSTQMEPTMAAAASHVAYPATANQFLHIDANSNSDASTMEVPQHKDEWLKKMRGSLMVVAVLVASVTFQAGLNPPGGFWQDDGQGQTAGYPIFADKSYTRYVIYMSCNNFAFVQSLLVLALLMTETAFQPGAGLTSLRTSVFMVLGALWMTYFVGYVPNIGGAVGMLLIYFASSIPLILQFTHRINLSSLIKNMMGIGR